MTSTSNTSQPSSSALSLNADVRSKQGNQAQSVTLYRPVVCLHRRMAHAQPFLLDGLSKWSAGISGDGSLRLRSRIGCLRYRQSPAKVFSTLKRWEGSRKYARQICKLRERGHGLARQKVRLSRCLHLSCVVPKVRCGGWLSRSVVSDDSAIVARPRLHLTLTPHWQWLVGRVQ